MVLAENQNGGYNSKLKPLYTAFLNIVKFSRYKMGIKFDKDSLAVEQNSYLTKIVNVYIGYDLAAWPRNPTNNFTFNNCLFRAINIAKNSEKEKYVYSGWQKTFDSAFSWSFVNNFARNVMLFSFDNKNHNLILTIAEIIF